MEVNANDLIPAIATPPGRILRDELEARGITQKDFAAMIGMKAPNLSELIHGKRKVTVAIAIKLEQALGIPFHHWIKMQSLYEYDIKMIALRDARKAVTAVPYSTGNWAPAQYAQEP